MKDEDFTHHGRYEDCNVLFASGNARAPRAFVPARLSRRSAKRIKMTQAVFAKNYCLHSEQSRTGIAGKTPARCPRTRAAHCDRKQIPRLCKKALQPR